VARFGGLGKSCMSVEFIDTNVLVYAHDGGAGRRHDRSVDLLHRLFEEANGSLSVQVLSEFYSVATKKLSMKSEEAEEAISDLSGWIIHRPGHADVLRAIRLLRRYKISWWDAMVINSAIELGCSILWSEDLAEGQRYGTVTVRSPFR
jgi:predicted nucleic acid-binding protein